MSKGNSETFWHPLLGWALVTDCIWTINSWSTVRGVYGAELKHRGATAMQRGKQTGRSVFGAASSLILAQHWGQPQKTHPRHRGAIMHWLFFFFFLSLEPCHNKGSLTSTLLQCASNRFKELLLLQCQDQRATTTPLCTFDSCGSRF